MSNTITNTANTETATEIIWACEVPGCNASLTVIPHRNYGEAAIPAHAAWHKKVNALLSDEPIVAEPVETEPEVEHWSDAVARRLASLHFDDDPRMVPASDAVAAIPFDTIDFLIKMDVATETVLSDIASETKTVDERRLFARIEDARREAYGMWAKVHNPAAVTS